MDLFLLLQAHAGATWFMVGLIWFAQVVHYPLLAGVGPSESVAFQREHMRLTSFVVAGPMLVELGTAVALVWMSGGSLAWSGLALVAVIWGTTGLGGYVVGRSGESIARTLAKKGDKYE